MDKVKAAKGDGKKLGRVVEEEFGGEAVDCDYVSAADGVEEGGVRRGAVRARDIVGSESSVCLLGLIWTRQWG